MNKYLIISPSGRVPLFKEWIQGNDIPNFDLVLLFYEDDASLAKEYTQYTPYVFMGKGEKWHLVKSFIESNEDFISQYKYVWFPCDDISLDTKNINRLFSLAEQYDLQLCQPALKGHYSHQITLPVSGNLLRYTNFVEIMASLFSVEALLKLYNTFDLIYSGWGYDYLWPYLLGYPKDKIAIIDDIVMDHTKPVGGTYSKERFPVPPHEEMNMLLQKYEIYPSQVNYSFISK
jgi:hypothetical protein